MKHHHHVGVGHGRARTGNVCGESAEPLPGAVVAVGDALPVAVGKLVGKPPSACAWLPVVGFEGLYEVSSAGFVRSVATGRVLKAAPINELGHLQVKLYRDGRQHGRLVHRMVLEAHDGPCPPGMEGRHVRWRDPSVNAVEGLAWGTSSENEHDKRRQFEALTAGVTLDDLCASIAKLGKWVASRGIGEVSR